MTNEELLTFAEILRKRGASKENIIGFVSADGLIRGYISRWCNDGDVICDIYDNKTDKIVEGAARVPAKELENVQWITTFTDNF